MHGQEFAMTSTLLNWYVYLMPEPMDARPATWRKEKYTSLVSTNDQKAGSVNWTWGQWRSDKKDDVIDSANETDMKPKTSYLHIIERLIVKMMINMNATNKIKEHLCEMATQKK